MELKEVIRKELENMRNEYSQINDEEFEQLVDIFEESYTEEMLMFGDPLEEVIENIENGDIGDMAYAMDEPGHTLWYKLEGLYEE